MKDHRDLRIEWDAKLLKSAKYKNFVKKRRNGTLKPEDVHDYAVLLSNTLTEVLKKNFGEELTDDDFITSEMANELISPLIRTLHGRVNLASKELQESVNKRMKLGLKPLDAEYNAERVEGLLNKIIAERFGEAAKLLDLPIENIALNTISEFCETNIRATNKVGIPMKLRRIATAGCCPWCGNLSRDFDYPAPKEAYQRHEGCRCVTYTIYPNGKRGDVWNKVAYDSSADEKQIQEEIRARTKDLEQMKKRQKAWRKQTRAEMLAEEENAKSMKELIAIAEKRGYNNPRGWAYHHWFKV